MGPGLNLENCPRHFLSDFYGGEKSVIWLPFPSPVALQRLSFETRQHTSSFTENGST